MNRIWISVVVAACFEVVWVIGLKHATTSLEWFGTLVAIGVSFYLMIMAGRYLPVGTVYSVFVGLGTVGAVFADTFFFGQPLHWLKIGLIGVLILGVVGLKVLSDSEGRES